MIKEGGRDRGVGRGGWEGGLVTHRAVARLLHGPVFTDGLFEQVLGYGDLSLCALNGDESLGAARLRLLDHDGGLGVVADLSYPLPTRS